jgi:hypothetical protein
MHPEDNICKAIASLTKQPGERTSEQRKIISDLKSQGPDAKPSIFSHITKGKAREVAAKAKDSSGRIFSFARKDFEVR